jgi:hypothetical protein
MTSARGYSIRQDWPARVRLPNLRSLASSAALVAFVLLVGVAAEKPDDVRLAIAATAAVFLVGLAARSPAGSLLVLFVWLVVLAMSRRLISELAPITSMDPLLLVSPLLLIVLTGAAAQRGAFRNRSALSNGVLVLSLLALFGAVNPLQGSLFGGVSGLLFILVPMLAFWIGRVFCDDRILALFLNLVAGFGLAVAIYGLVQTYAGFPGWDRQWINDVQFSYAALNVGGVIRPFATFSSASEYSMFLALAIIVWLTKGRRLSALPFTLVALAVIVPALVLASARGAVVALIATLGLLVGAYRRLPITMSAGAGLLLLVALVFGLRHYGPTTYGAGAPSSLLSHQVQGLSDPLNSQTSTLGTHLSELRKGLEQAFIQPVGEGVGAVTIAGGKFGGVSKGTELDPSNVGVGLGLPGLLAYLVVLVAGMLRLYRVAMRRRDGLGLAALGVVTLTLGQWLNGGQYAVAVIPWLVLGWVDRPQRPSGAAGSIVDNLRT